MKEKKKNKQTLQLCSPDKSIFQTICYIPSKKLIILQEATLPPPTGYS